MSIVDDFAAIKARLAEIESRPADKAEGEITGADRLAVNIANSWMNAPVPDGQDADSDPPLWYPYMYTAPDSDGA